MFDKHLSVRFSFAFQSLTHRRWFLFWRGRGMAPFNEVTDFQAPFQHYNFQQPICLPSRVQLSIGALSVPSSNSVTSSRFWEIAFEALKWLCTECGSKVPAYPLGFCTEGIEFSPQRIAPLHKPSICQPLLCTWSKVSMSLLLLVSSQFSYLWDFPLKFVVPAAPQGACPIGVNVRAMHLPLRKTFFSQCQHGILSQVYWGCLDSRNQN